MVGSTHWTQVSDVGANNPNNFLMNLNYDKRIRYQVSKQYKSVFLIYPLPAAHARNECYLRSSGIVHVEHRYLY